MLNQKLQQKLLQKLSPQQILLMKLLQIPSVALEQRIKQEIEENPALEETESPDETQSTTLENVQVKDNEQEQDENNDPTEEFDLSDYIEDDDIPAYRLLAGNTSSNDEQYDIPHAADISFHEYLMSQLGMRNLTPKQKIIAENIIGNLDNSGYLQRDPVAMVDDLAFSQNVTTTPDEIMKVLTEVQDLDPPGLAARNLKECLLLQLKRKTQTPAIKLAYLILDRYFDEFTRKHYERILRKAKITEGQLRTAIEEVLKLNPKPGNALSETTKPANYVVPDFIIENNDGELVLTLNNRNAPELKLNRTYIEMLEAYSDKRNKNIPQQREAISFIKHKLDSAKWFIDAIRQRHNTLYLTMKAIMDYQYRYFLEGDITKLKPMVLKDIAEIVNLDISTVSRVANSKYVQTPFGTFLLKSFFSESMQTDSGEEVSTREIKKILSDCIYAEEKTKPLTDDQLTVILRSKGYNIARRTVAKYREQLNIPVARLRKEL